MSEFHITDYNARNMAFSHIARFHFYKTGNANLWRHYAWLSGHLAIDPFGPDRYNGLTEAGAEPFRLRTLYSDGYDQ